MNFKIQYLSYEEDKRFVGNGITISKISAPRSLDEFNINIIDLTSSNLWTCNAKQADGLNIRKELFDLKRMIAESLNTKILIIFPQNIWYKFYWGKDSNQKYRFLKSLQIKELIGNHLEYWICDLAEIPSGILVYEKTITSLKGINYNSDFHFSYNYFCDDKNILTKSLKSNKSTTVKIYNTYFTVLEITSYNELINFLDNISLIELEETTPDWILELPLFDDKELNEIIKCKEAIICECNNHINYANEKLKKNNTYKSILYTNGDELLGVVFEMLEKMLSYDLSAFKDEKKEDFLISLEEITFIGEIKGVTSNIKSEHISQLDVHFQGYMDAQAEQEKIENVKAILIIDHQRTQKLSCRQPVHINQIKLAERNESLIIETSIFLKIFEAFTKKEISSNEIIKMFTDSKGLLIF